MSYPPNKPDFDTDPCGYEAPTGLAVNFDRACLPGSTRLNLCGTPGGTTLNLGCYKPQLILDLTTSFSVLFSTFLSISSITIEEGSVVLTFSTLIDSASAANISNAAVFSALVSFFRVHSLLSKGDTALEAALSDNLAALQKLFARATVSAQLATRHDGRANIQESASFFALNDALVQGNASVSGQVPLAVVLSLFYTVLATCFSAAQLNGVVTAITAHFARAYGATPLGVEAAGTYLNSLHFGANYIDSIITYIDVLGSKFDLGIISIDGRIVRLQMKDGVVRISFSDKLSDVTGVFEKTLIAPPTVRIIQLVNSDKIVSVKQSPRVAVLLPADKIELTG